MLLYLIDYQVRFLLVIASAASFAPQINRVRHHGDCTSISMSYVMFNLIVSTYNLILRLHGAMFVENTIWFRRPAGVGDWLNLAQFAVTTLRQLLLLLLAVQLPPYRPVRKELAVTAYLSFLTVTLVPAIGMMLIPPKDRDWPSALLEYFSLFLLGPAIQLLGLAPFIIQACRVKQGSDSALSIQGLTIHAAVFFLVGISFLYRNRIPSEELDEHFIVNLRSWCWKWGWAIINNIVFAFAQGILAWLVSRLKCDDAGERTALLST